MSTQFKKITDYTPIELNEAVEETVKYCQANKLDFYTILRGIDAYMERRARKETAYTEELLKSGQGKQQNVHTR